MTYSGTITYGGVTLYITSLTPKRVQYKKKQVLGKTVVEVPIIGLNSQQWELQINGIMYTDIDTERTALEALDDATPHAFVDGLHNQNYYIKPGSLSFKDSGDRGGMSYTYSMTLLQS